MKLDFAVFADGVTLSADQGLFSLLNGGVEWIDATEFPAMVPNLVLVIRFVFAADECGHPHDCTVHVADPDGIHLQPELSMSVNPSPNPRHPEGESRFIGRFGYDRITFPKSGIYGFSVVVDGQEIGYTELEACAK